MTFAVLLISMALLFLFLSSSERPNKIESDGAPDPKIPPEIPFETQPNSIGDNLKHKDITHDPPGEDAQEFSDVRELIDPPAEKTTRLI